MEEGVDSTPQDPTGGITAVDRVETHLERLVFGDLAVGASLPSENELARTLRVSRLTVREGVRKLQARGLITTGQGRRPQVAAPDGLALADFFQATARHDARAILDLLELRQALEVHAAAAAATRASRADLAALEEHLDAMRTSAGEPDRLHEADLRFHQALATAGGNRLITMLLRELAGPLRASRVASHAGHLQRGLSVAVTIEQHEAVLTAVRQRDPRSAAAAMRRHLRQTERDLASALSSAPDDHG